MAETQQEGRKAIFRVPLITLLAVVFLAVCMIPAAFADVPGLWLMYVIPIGLFVFVVRTRTVASARGLDVRTVFGHRELPWSSLKGLAINDKAKVRAVLTDGSEVPLPSVRTRHLPVISLVSEGRMKDPSGLTDDLDTEDAEDVGKDTGQS
ncbi:PH domain-containing protein [Amycolatopsis sp. NPDC006131]|uniref:PH domain-containing protein n=1 Tax=Amycolatopsis sp. NPDC006131 TaxID=3156731 RepID=UPI0033B0F0A6